MGDREDGLIRSEEGFIEGLELRARQTMMHCGIYEVGDPERCYIRLLVSDGGFVMPLRGISEDDALTLFVQGYHEGSPKPSDADPIIFDDHFTGDTHGD